MPISLKPHNIEVLRKVLIMLKEKGRALVVQPPGTGKMFIGLKLLEYFKQMKAIYLAPSNATLHDVKKNIFAERMTMEDFPNLTRMTYQKLALMSDEEIDKIKVGFIIVDEVQFCGAPIYGAKLKRLIKNNPKALLLGLTADTIRWFDGYRDMGEELFPDCEASRMTFDEAIERGILPDATYVTALYGYVEELENMQEKINQTEDPEKKQQAQALFNVLKEKLDKNTQNMGQLFKKYMNPNGKYIIFCKNEEDMREKMEQAQEMFGKVNPNITVRAVSSKIKETDEILTEFENDNEEGTLKLMYAINMLNVGYHIPGLDGVIMMRPTCSPGLFTQQLGRGFSVGGNKKPLILDLVNNFDSCRIIADFTERMKKYEGNTGSGRKARKKSSRISIYDNTKEFREIVDKIEWLTSQRETSLEEKIQIIEKFSAEHDEKIEGKTVYQGYPIGQWAIMIRYWIKQIKNGTSKGLKINPTEEQYRRLENLGILERQFGSTVDEKIDTLIEWRKKHPELPFRPRVALDNISDESLREEYKKLLDDYQYLLVRMSKKALSDEQISKCKEGNLGGRFGLSTKEKEALEKYGLSEEKIKPIIKKYGSLDAFRKLYIEALINDNISDFEKDNKELLSDLKLIKRIDLSSPDFAMRLGRFGELANTLIDNYLDRGEINFFVDYKDLEEKIVEIIKGDSLNDNEKKILDYKYPEEGENNPTFRYIGTQMGLTHGRIGIIYHNALRKFLWQKNKRYIDLENRIKHIDYDLWVAINEEYFKNHDIFATDEPISMDDEIKKKLTQMITDGINKTEQRVRDAAWIGSMPEEKKLEILRRRFGDKIENSDIMTSPPGSVVRKLVNEKRGGVPVDQKIFEYFGYYSRHALYKECVDSEYTQSMIVELMVEKIQDKELLEEGKVEEITTRIDCNSCFDEERKNELKETLKRKLKEAKKRSIEEKIGNWTSSDWSSMEIDEMGLSVRLYNILRRSSYKWVQDFIGKTEDDLKKIRNIGIKDLVDLKERLAELNIKMVDGCLRGSECDSNLDFLKILKAEIDQCDIAEEHKEELRLMLYKQFVKVATSEEISRCIEEGETQYDDILREGVERKKIKEEEAMLSIESLKLAGYSNVLLRRDITTIPQLIGKKSDDFWRMGKRGNELLVEAMKSVGLEFRDGIVVDVECPEPKSEEEARQRILKRIRIKKAIIGAQEKCKEAKLEAKEGEVIEDE